MKQKLLLDYLISSLSLEMDANRLEVPQFIVERRPEEIWKQKIFCVLSSQFNAHRAASIADNIVQEISFFDFPLSYTGIEAACSNFLRSSKIGHRFPNIRAQQIWHCWFLFSQIKDQYHEFIQSFETEERARTEIAAIFPGMGLKQASMFLRNIGACKNLAVIDAHALYYLEVFHDWTVGHLTPKRYLEAEAILRDDASRYSLEQNVFDTIMWAATKAVKRVGSHV
jgi:N-glycosylase/DNA lyase